MASKSGRYFRHLLKGYQGVAQGNPLSPTIVNVVVDSVSCHWVAVVTSSEAGTGVLGMMIIDLATYFYAYNGLVASTQPERLQREFDVFAGPFDIVGLCTNIANTVGIVCQL